MENDVEAINEKGGGYTKEELELLALDLKWLKSRIDAHFRHKSVVGFAHNKPWPLIGKGVIKVRATSEFRKTKYRVMYTDLWTFFRAELPGLFAVMTQKDLQDIPLYINDKDTMTRLAALWRLRIAR